MSNYILIDTLNLYFRARHSTGRAYTIDDKIGMALHIMFSGIKKMWNDNNGDHIVMFLEGKSWRYDFYPEYKGHRKIKQLQRTAKEIEEDEVLFEALNDFIKFMSERTNITVVQSPNAEADDNIAMWIKAHPEDNHYLLSTDSDFYQLLAPNMEIYNGVSRQTITLEGIYDEKGKFVKDKKTGLPKPAPIPEWTLFEKCIRGDSSDNIFSAYPKVRKTKIAEAYEDRDNKGYAWNNMMLQRWTDHEGVEHRVKDKYERNRKLIDLNEQPEEIKKECIEAIIESTKTEQKSNVGIFFMKFCNKWNLVNLAKYPQEYADILNKKYNGVL